MAEPATKTALSTRGPTLAFSHSQYTSVQSGAPPCVSSPLESGEKARHTNSLDITSAETAWSTCRPRGEPDHSYHRPRPPVHPSRLQRASARDVKSPYVMVATRRTFRRLSVCRSKTVTSAFSPSAARSATATYFLLGLTAIAVMPSVFSVPEIKRCVFCSVLKITTLWPAG